MENEKLNIDLDKSNIDQAGNKHSSELAEEQTSNGNKTIVRLGRVSVFGPSLDGDFYS